MPVVGAVYGDLRHLENARKAYLRKRNAVLKGIALDGRKRCQDIAARGFTRSTKDTKATLKGVLDLDTGALAASFYVRGLGFDDYEARVQEMVDKYTHRYSWKHAMERIAAPVEVGPSQIAFGSCSRVMAFWEYGHYNHWTKMEEKQPILRPVRELIRASAVRKMQVVKNLE